MSTVHIGELAAWLGVILNMALLIWGAAKVTSKVENLGDSITKLNETIGTLMEKVDHHSTDIAHMQGSLSRSGIHPRST